MVQFMDTSNLSLTPTSTHNIPSTTVVTDSGTVSVPWPTMNGGGGVQVQRSSSNSRTKYVLGICAMDKKARSLPMQSILSRLKSHGEFDVLYFGDHVLLEEDIHTWPICDFLIAFYSTHFPLLKAISYANLRQPFLVNDLSMQQLLRDRRLVLMVLDACGIPTPRRLFTSRDGGPKVGDAELAERLWREFSIELNKEEPPAKVVRVDEESIEVNGVKMRMPFVEKPVDGENHDVYIYFDKSRGGGVRKLFRKVANRSSEYVPGHAEIRSDASYIYEEFLDVDNAEDVKVYTVGMQYAYAETRKSPVVDGEVVRSHTGKEVRRATLLTPTEKKIARQVSRAFRQTICGFDMLRYQGKSLVMDVNGWSFVKGNEAYYDDCTKMLRRVFLNATKEEVLVITIGNREWEGNNHVS